MTDVDGDQRLTPVDGGAAPWRRPPRDSRAPRRPKVSAAVEALAAAGAALLVLPGLGQLQRQVLVRSEVGFVVGVVLSVAAAFAVAAGLHRWLGGGRRRDAGAVGVVTAALAGTAWGVMPVVGGWGLWQYLPPRTVLWAAALGAAVVAVRAGGARLAGGLAGVTAGFAVAAAVQSGWPLLTSYLSVPRVSVATPVEQTADVLPGARGAVRQDDRAGPTLGGLCHPDELEITTTVPVRDDDDVVTTLTATNVGGRECRVEGWPSLRLRSEDVDLALDVHVSQTDPAGDHLQPGDVWLQPGASARTQVWWPPWGAAADLDAAQQLRVGVGGGTAVVDLPASARWDVARSAEVWVAPWQPAP